MLSKRLGRKRCCDTTPDRCLEVCRLTIFASHCKKMLRLLPKIEGFGGIPGPEAYQIKNEYAQRRRLRRINSLPKKGEVFTTWAPLPNPKIKASLSKVQAVKFIFQIAASKQENCVFPNSNLQILSSKSKSTLFFCQLVQLQVFKNLSKKSTMI